MVQPAYGVDQTTGNNLLVAIGSATDQFTVQMTAPITHTGRSWYNQDFIVFSNQGFIGKSRLCRGRHGYVRLSDRGRHDLRDASAAECQPDGVTFYTVTPSSSVAFPENPYHWDGLKSAPSTAGWGALNDFSKPVNPALTASDFANQTVAYADNTLYNGSAGERPTTSRTKRL